VRPASVNSNVAAGHKGGRIGNQQRNRACNLRILTEPFEHGFGCQLGIESEVGLVGYVGKEAGPEAAYPDAVLCQIRSGIYDICG